MKYFRHFVLMLVLSVAFSSVFAAPSDPSEGTYGTDPGCGPQIPFCDCPINANIPPCPIDGGVVALLAAGIGLGLKRMRDIKKNVGESII